MTSLTAPSGPVPGGEWPIQTKKLSAELDSLSILANEDYIAFQTRLDISLGMAMVIVTNRKTGLVCMAPSLLCPCLRGKWIRGTNFD